jgi:hypothetical protein
MDLDKMTVDDFFKEKEKQPEELVIEKKKEETLEVKFAKERLEWSAKLDTMSAQMKDVFKVSELLTTVYTERQRAVEYYYYLLSVLSKVSRIYRKQFAEKYDYYSFKSQVRFPNERVKEVQILSEIEDIVAKREAIDNHSKFINSTIDSIDKLLFGIKFKVEIEQISRGK